MKRKLKLSFQNNCQSIIVKNQKTHFGSAILQNESEGTEEQDESEETKQSCYLDVGIPFTVFLDGTIGMETDSTNRIIKQLLYWEHKNIQFAYSDGVSYPIILYICSYGGEVYDTLSIVDTIKGLSSPVVTYCSGKCMSGAGVLLALGEKGHRLASPNSWLMFHQLSAGCTGTMDALKNYTNHLSSVETQIENLIFKNSKLTRKKVKELLSKDTYISPKQALKFGLIDKIVQKVPKIIDGCAMSYITNLKKKPTPIVLK